MGAFAPFFINPKTEAMQNLNIGLLNKILIYMNDFPEGLPYFILIRTFDKPNANYQKHYSYLSGQGYIELDPVEEILYLTDKSKQLIEEGGFK